MPRDIDKDDVINTALVGGGLISAGGGAQILYDYEKARSLAEDWANESRAVNSLKKKAPSAIGEKPLLYSPEWADKAFNVYRDNSRKMLNRRYFGIPGVALYDIAQSFVEPDKHQGIVLRKLLKRDIERGAVPANLSPTEYRRYLDGVIADIDNVAKLKDNPADILLPGKKYKLDTLGRLLRGEFARVYNTGRNWSKRDMRLGGKTHASIYATESAPITLIHHLEGISAAQSLFKKDDGKRVVELHPLLRDLGLNEENFNLTDLHKKLTQAAGPGGSADKTVRNTYRNMLENLENAVFRPEGSFDKGLLTTMSRTKYPREIQRLLNKKSIKLPIRIGGGLLAAGGLAAAGIGGYNLYQDNK
jgi:hypothetical protein